MRASLGTQSRLYSFREHAQRVCGNGFRLYAARAEVYPVMLEDFSSGRAECPEKQ